MKITAKQLKFLLAQKHADDLFVEECRIGFSSYGATGYIDAWAMKKSWAKPLTIGYEVKVSRHDFVQDDKWVKYVPYCNQFYFVAPYGLIDKKEVPDGAGLITATTTGSRLYTKVKAPRKDIDLGILEPLYKGILMSRVNILSRKDKSGCNTLEDWEQFLQEKEECRRYGRGIRGKLRKLYDSKIKSVELENRELRENVYQYKEIENMLEEMGLKADNCAAYSLRCKFNLNKTKYLCRAIDDLVKEANIVKKKISDFKWKE